MPCRRPLRQLALELAQPLKLGAKLLNHQTDHPHRFMVSVADFRQNRAQRLLLPRQFLFDKLAAPSKLFFEDSRPREPGKRDPSRENGMIALIGPVFALQGLGSRSAATLRGRKDGALRPGCRLAARLLADETGGG